MDNLIKLNLSYNITNNLIIIMNKFGNISNNLIMVMNNIERIKLEHLSEEIPKKYNISDELKERCKKLKVLLDWKQCPSNSNDLKECRFIWKPKEVLIFECERREKQRKKKKQEKRLKTKII